MIQTDRRTFLGLASGAGLALAGVLGLRLAHWLAYSDEDWWKELSSHDRYANFVVPVPGLGLRRLPGMRDEAVPVGGALTAVLDAATDERQDAKGWLRESLAAVLPPLPTTPLGQQAIDQMRNKNWMGSPIVPKRDEHAPLAAQVLDHRGPYALQQLTGGRGEASLRGAGLVPFTEVRNARRSVDEMYDRLHALEQQRTAARGKGLRFTGEAEYQRLHAAERGLKGLRDEMNRQKAKGLKEPTPERKAAINREMTEIAWRAIGAK